MTARENHQMAGKTVKDERAGRRRGVLLLLAAAALAGYYLGFRLPEERRNRINKMLFEARELPFRLFV